jgi:hypothetical protein
MQISCQNYGTVLAYANLMPINKICCGTVFATASFMPTSCANDVPRIHGTVLQLYHGTANAVKQIKKLFFLLTLSHYSAILGRPAQIGTILA